MEEVKLNYDNPNFILDNLKKLSGDPDFTDVTLAFEDDTRISANKIFLSAISPVLRNPLKKLKGSDPCILLFGMDSNMFKLVLDFVYSGEICIQKNSLEQFLEFSDRLKIEGLALNEQHTVQRAGVISKQEGVSSQEAFYDNDLSLDEYADCAPPTDSSSDMTMEAINALERNIDPECEKMKQPMVGIIKDGIIKPVKDKNSTLKESIAEETYAAGIRCWLCKKPFESMESLTEHEKKVHTRENTKYYKCEFCDLEFHKNLLLNQHRRKVHENTDPSSNACDVCGKAFKNQNSMLKHKDYAHPVPGRLFKCKLCPKESMTKNASNVHYYQAHPDWERKAFEGKV